MLRYCVFSWFIVIAFVITEINSKPSSGDVLFALMLILFAPIVAPLVVLVLLFA